MARWASEPPPGLQASFARCICHAEPLTCFFLRACPPSSITPFPAHPLVKLPCPSASQTSRAAAATAAADTLWAPLVAADFTDREQRSVLFHVPPLSRPSDTAATTTTTTTAPTPRDATTTATATAPLEKDGASRRLYYKLAAARARKAAQAAEQNRRSTILEMATLGRLGRTWGLYPWAPYLPRGPYHVPGPGPGPPAFPEYYWGAGVGRGGGGGEGAGAGLVPPPPPPSSSSSSSSTWGGGGRWGRRSGWRGPWSGGGGGFGAGWVAKQMGVSPNRRGGDGGGRHHGHVFHGGM